MRARDIMTSPVVTVAPDAHLKDVAATFVRRGINAAPVVDHGRLLGIVSEADIIPSRPTPAVSPAGRRREARRRRPCERS